MLALGSAAATANAADAPRGDSVLVRVDEDASPRERSVVGRALDASSARTLVGGWRVYELSQPLTVGEARRRLADVDAAEAVQRDAPLRALETPDDTHFGLQWPLQAIDAPLAWDQPGAAAPVTVAVIDTGVDTAHPDLAGRLWSNTGEIAANGLDDDANGYVDDVQGWNFFDGTNQVYSAADGDSHGTHVAGIVAARRGNATGIAGVADNARVMPLKFLKPGGGFTSDAILAIQYAVANGAKVINASWGGGGYSQALCEAIADAGDAGVLFVVAAGNSAADNDATGAWPTNCPAPTLISVAATAPADALAAFSNRGATQVDVGAPGTDVLATIPAAAYGYKSGTSMAAPVVSGIAAAVVGLHPGLAAWQVKAAITAGGDLAPALAGTTASGRRVDLLGTLLLADAGIGPDTAAPDPFAAVSPAPGLATTNVVPLFRWAPATDGQSGVAGYRLTLDGAVAAAVAPGATSASPSAPLPEGVHNWSVSALDAAGNLRATETRALLVDRTGPSAPAPSSPRDGAEVKGPGVTLAWTPSTDAVSGVAGYRVIIDGVGALAVGGGEGSARVTLAPGRHTWSVVAADAADNETIGPQRSITVVRQAGAGVRPLRLSGPARIAPGAPVRLRIDLVRRARVTFAVRRAGSSRPLVRVARLSPAGRSAVVLPGAVGRLMRRPGAYVVSANAPGGLRDVIRLRVA